MMLLFIFSFVSICLFAMGTYIWQKEAIWLLSNFSAESVRDKKGLARWAGMFLYLFAVLMLLFGYAVYRLNDTPYEIVPVLALILCSFPLAITYMLGGQRFLRRNLKNDSTNG